MLKLHINYVVVMGRPNEPIATLTKLRWVLLRVKIEKDRFNAFLNHVVTSNVEELVQKFRKVESYSQLPKKDQLVAKNWCTCSSDSPIYHDQRKEQILSWTSVERWQPIPPFNRNMAIFRTLSLERKFEKQPSSKSKYAEITNFFEVSIFWNIRKTFFWEMQEIIWGFRFLKYKKNFWGGLKSSISQNIRSFFSVSVFLKYVRNFFRGGFFISSSLGRKVQGSISRNIRKVFFWKNIRIFWS